MTKASRRNVMPHLHRGPNGERLTLLDCALGNHTGHFAIHIIRLPNGQRTSACADHLPKEN